MTGHSEIDRRSFATGLAAASAVYMGVPQGSALAQPPAPEDAWQELADLSARARRLGLAVPVVTSAGQGSAQYREIMPAIVDFIDKLEEAAAKSTAPQAEVDGLKQRATSLLRRIHRNERAPRQKSGQLPQGSIARAQLGSSAIAQPLDNEARFQKYRDGYLALFAACQVRSEHRSDVDWYVEKLKSDRYRAQYQTVEDQVCVPWYFVGIAHALEASFSFDSHLHNGDPLSEKTVNVPAGRPPVWDPPNDWVSSAKDALTYEHFANLQDWSLARTLFRWEAYNGFRSREEHGINSPYLWSFSNQYEKGKFIADDVWSSDAVSRQCGAAVMLKVLVDRGIVTFSA